jgi:hypothetical protein
MSMIMYRTSVGDFAIVQIEDCRCNLLLDGECIGTYEEWQDAADALCAGEVFQPTAKYIDYDMLEIPRNILEWEYFP